MAILKLTAFAGETPKITPRLLGDGSAQIALNTRLDDGGLSPIRKKKFVYQFPGMPAEGYKTITRHAGEWLGWTGDVYAVPGPVAADRLYIMGDGAPKMKVGATYYPLAVPLPTGTLTAAVSGTASSELGSTRVYAYTWVTAFGEESEPILSNEVYWKPGQTVTLSGFASTPGGRNITTQRLYRSQTSQTGTQLYYIGERAASTGNYVDNVAVSAFQGPLPSLDWNPPIAELTGLVAMPNGMMAAFSGKDLYFCEPYRPHAWPAKYTLTLDYDIVGLGVYENTLIVTTTGHPYMVNGTAPEVMYSRRLELNLPCINARCIADLGYSVAYPSHDGLALASAAGAQIISSQLFSRREWASMNLGLSTAGQFDSRYLLSYAYTDENGIEHEGMLIFDLSGAQPFIIRSNEHPSALHYELEGSQLFLLIGDKVYEWDAQGQASELQAWKSKLFVLPKPTNFGALLVEVDEALTLAAIEALQDEAAADQAINDGLFAGLSIGGEVNGGEVNLYPNNGDALLIIRVPSYQLSVNVYADRKLVASVGTANKAMRLPSGFKSALWEIEVVSDVPVAQVLIAGTAYELAGA